MAWRAIGEGGVVNQTTQQRISQLEGSCIPAHAHFGDVHEPLRWRYSQSGSINKKGTRSEFSQEHGNFKGLESRWRLLYSDSNGLLVIGFKIGVLLGLLVL